MIPEIRSFFKTIIGEVDPDLKQHDRYFISDDIADTNKEDRYHLLIGQLLGNRIDTNISGELAVTLKFWKNGNNDELERIDLAYCKALEIQRKLMDQTRLSQTEFIHSIDGVGIEPVALLSNDNLAEFELQFMLTVAYNSL